MTRQEPSASGSNDHRGRLALAVVTGVFGGIARAVTGWLLERWTGF